MFIKVKVTNKKTDDKKFIEQVIFFNKNFIRSMVIDENGELDKNTVKILYEEKPNELNVECITFAIDYSYLLSLLIPLEKDFTNYLCSNNKFVFQLYHSRMEIPFLNKQLKNKINLDDYTVFKTVKDETTRVLEKNLIYRNKEVLFYSVKIDKENDRIVVI